MEPVRKLRLASSHELLKQAWAEHSSAPPVLSDIVIVVKYLSRSAVESLSGPTPGWAGLRLAGSVHLPNCWPLLNVHTEAYLLVHIPYNALHQRPSACCAALALPLAITAPAVLDGESFLGGASHENGSPAAAAFMQACIYGSPVRLG